jgi:hypothetical protein
MKYKILYPEDYKFIPETHDTINLADQIVIYFDGVKWKIVPLLVCMAHPIIYDYYYINDKKIPITVVVCPVSLRSILVKGRFVLNSYVKESTDIASIKKINTHDNKIKIKKGNKTKLIIRESVTNNLMSIDIGTKMDSEHFIYVSKRSEVQIMTLRNAILFASDPIYISLDVKSIKPLINLSYYTNNEKIDNTVISLKDNNYHPKTLVRLIKCESDNTIIIGSDASLNAISGYDVSKTLLNTYLQKNQEKLIENNCFIMNVLLYVALKAYPKGVVTRLTG